MTHEGKCNGRARGWRPNKASRTHLCRPFPGAHRCPPPLRPTPSPPSSCSARRTQDETSAFSAQSGLVSTWVGARLGRPGAVGVKNKNKSKTTVYEPPPQRNPGRWQSWHVSRMLTEAATGPAKLSKWPAAAGKPIAEAGLQGVKKSPADFGSERHSRHSLYGAQRAQSRITRYSEIQAPAVKHEKRDRENSGNRLLRRERGGPA